jgi:putative nucleotidyltransferase with HDIG domain
MPTRAPSDLRPPDPTRVPEPVLEVLRVLRRGGKQAFLAGGAVRDLLLEAQGRAPAAQGDFDIATDALPEQVQKLFPRTAPTGIAHGTITVLTGSGPVEVTTFRGEGPYLDGRRPSSVTFLGDIEGDLARRDFTVNAIAWDPMEPGFAGIRDPFGGLADLRRGVLRAVGRAEDRFAEDGLRPLRAVRLATILKFALEPRTRKAIPATLDTFAKVAAERVRDELTKLLLRGQPASRGLRLLARTGLLRHIVPELTEAVGHPQNRWHAFDVWEHTLRAVDNAPRDLVVRLAALLHDVGKPRSAGPGHGPGEHTFYNHDKLGAEMTVEILSRLRFPKRDVVERVAHLVREHNWHYLPEWNDATIRRTIARVGKEELEPLWQLRRADLQARGRFVEEGLQTQRALEERVAAALLQTSALSVKDLAIGGQDVMEVLQISPGKLVGQVLAKLLDAVLDEPDLNTRADLLKRAPEVARELSTDNPQGVPAGRPPR